jgi:hypothetical protein
MRYLALLWPFALAACATTDSGYGNVAIETASKGRAITGAHCVVSIGSGSWNVVTPGTVPAGQAYGDLRAVCNKSGYRTSEVIYRPTARPANSNLGIGIGGGSGNVGVALGLGIPIRLGGNGYPTRITVDMNPQ